MNLHLFRFVSAALAGTALAALLAAPLQAESLETFDDDPRARGWQVFGEPSLFQWNAAEKALDVTWDSAVTNSYYYRPLGNILTKADDFGFAFDLELADISAGTTPGKPSAFQIVLGFFNLAQATQPGFLRGTGVNSTNLVEFDYFPDAGFGATVWPLMVSTNGSFNYSGSTDLTLITLETGVRLRVVMRYDAAERTLFTSLWRDGQPYGSVNPVKVADAFSDFRVDAIAVMSYSDAGQTDPVYAGSVLAHGRLDNFDVTLPAAPIRGMRPAVTAAGGVEFESRTGWFYTLVSSSDLSTWSAVSAAMPGTGGWMPLVPAEPAAGTVFYRVEAQRP